MSNTLDRKDLKIQALLEKVSNLTTQYENQIADLRVELTISEYEREALESKVHDFQDSDSDDVPSQD